MKRKFSIVALFFILFSVYGQTNTVKFIKGNISEKTAAVREASGDEAVFLSSKAIEFSLENKDFLGNDRELDGLVVAAIYSISSDYVKNTSEAQKKLIANQFIKLYSSFKDSSTVEIALLSRITVLKDVLPTKEIAESLNTYLKNVNVQTVDTSVFKAVLLTLESIGNTDTYLILFNYLNNPKFKIFYPEIEKTVSALIPDSMNETLALIQTSDLSQITQIFNLSAKNSKITNNSLCEISEKMLSRSILLLNDFSNITDDTISIQMNALKILEANKWTRASATVLSYFQLAKLQYNHGILTDDQFTVIIKSLSSIAPIDSVSILTVYLEELNSQTEKGNKASDEVVLSVIKTLGAIGDKSAFDSLLAVTYLTYSESVLTAAREALSGLRW